MIASHCSSRGSKNGGAGEGLPRFVAGAATPDRIPPPTIPEVAFAGKSNVGKSSLLNRLCGRKGLARVSKTPGRTQQLNFFLFDERLMLVDLPGYGFARVPLEVKANWKMLVEGYLTNRRTLRAVVVIVDVRRGIGHDDAQLLDFLDARGIRSILVATKLDKVKRGERRRLLEAVRSASGGRTVIAFSAVSGEGIDDLRAAIKASR